MDVTTVETIDFSKYMDDDTRRNLVFVAELWHGDQCLSCQTAYFAPTKHLLLTDPRIKTSVTLSRNLLTIKLSANSLARLVACSLPGADVIFSDNYFDLPADKTVSINAHLPEGWGTDRAKAALKVQSIYNTYSG